MIETRYVSWFRKVLVATVACLALMISAGYVRARFEEHRANRLIAIYRL